MKGVSKTQMHKDWQLRDTGDITMGSKKHKSIWGAGLALLLLGWQVYPALGGDSAAAPLSTGVVATITAIDAKTHSATLRTETGEVFELPQETLWQVGTKVLCDRIDAQRRRLQHCQPWETQYARGTTAPRERYTSSQ
jgi:hypothetical protein